jgi:class I fructose-bisphosphate aldolase
MDKNKTILDYYENDNAGVKTNLVRMLNHGKLAGTGKMIILPVDQGFEHGPVRSFAPNPEAYHPHYHFKLAIDAGLNAYAAPLGWLEAGAATFAGQIPTILKLNSANSLFPTGDGNPPVQAITGSIQDALRLGCVGVGFTIYPGSSKSYHMLEQIRALSEEAKAHGLVVIIWSYPRGEALSKAGETALDVCAYAAHIAALMGAHIVKVKLPEANIEQEEAKKLYNPSDYETLAARVAHVKQTTFAGRRLVIFSGGATKGDDGVLNDTKAIAAGGGDGSIIGRNAFQRPRTEALKLLQDMVDIYKK